MAATTQCSKTLLLYHMPSGHLAAFQSQGLHWSFDPTDMHQFPRLRLKFKESLVQLAGGTKHLPITKSEVPVLL